MGKIKTLSLDLETYSDVDLSKCGVYKYAESPAFEIRAAEQQKVHRSGLFRH